MLKEFSVRYVILGHSERRQYQKESDELISKKAKAAHAASLKPIVCVGEVLSERESGQMEKVLDTQVRGSLAGLTKEQMLETVKVAAEEDLLQHTPRRGRKRVGAARGKMASRANPATGRRKGLQ